jgi:Uma2 family endonuclease
MSPSRKHSVLQFAFATVLHDWACGRGWIGTAWRFRVTPLGSYSRPLVPDVAYITAERLAAFDESAREYPPTAPDIVVEILSSDDRDIDVDHKRDVYLAAGITLLLIVDPIARTMRADSPGREPRFLKADDTFATELVPGLTIDLRAIFAQLDVP